MSSWYASTAIEMAAAKDTDPATAPAVIIPESSWPPASGPGSGDLDGKTRRLPTIPVQSTRTEPKGTTLQSVPIPPSVMPLRVRVQLEVASTPRHATVIGNSAVAAMGAPSVKLEADRAGGPEQLPVPESHAPKKLCAELGPHSNPGASQDTNVLDI